MRAVCFSRGAIRERQVWPRNATGAWDGMEGAEGGLCVEPLRASRNLLCVETVAQSLSSSLSLLARALGGL